jgi:hypothetical protein
MTFGPIDALFAPLTETAPAGALQPGAGDEFAGLLAALMGNGTEAGAGSDGEPAASMTDGLQTVAVPLPAKPDDAKGYDSATSLLVVAMLSSAFPSTPIDTVPGDGKVADATGSAKTASGEAGASAPEAVLPAVETTVSLPDEVDPAGPVQSAAPDAVSSAGPGAAMAVRGEPLVPASDPGTPQPTVPVALAVSAADGLPTVIQTATTAPQPTTPEQGVTASADAVRSRPMVSDGTAEGDGGKQAPPIDGPDPGGSPGQPAVQSGVVRFVGNANNRNDANDGSHGEHGGEDSEPDIPNHERGMPHASATGIQHASEHSAVAQLRTATPDTPPANPAPASPPDAKQPPAVDQVAHAIIEKVEDGGGEARIRLDPPELGEVTIHVKITGDHVRVDVHAERPEAMQLLRDHTVDLSSLLGGRGLDLSDVYVGLGGRQAPDTGDNQLTGGRERRADGSEFASIIGIDEAPATGVHNRLRAAYNPDGTHVYRI